MVGKDYFEDRMAHEEEVVYLSNDTLEGQRI